MKQNNARPGLRPRKADPYFLVLGYFKANPDVLVLLALILTLIFSAVYVWGVVEAAHMAGVVSYGG